MTPAASVPVRQFPAVQQYMSLTPQTIACDRSIADAHALMRAHHIRHLPILDGGRVVGVVSERDLLLVSSLPGVDAREVAIEEAMVEDVFLVSPETPIAEVVETMIQKKVGSALVGTETHIAGVFTTIDALVALHELLERP
jgi:acetoin utilization protein AcuB